MLELFLNNLVSMVSKKRKKAQSSSVYFSLRDTKKMNIGVFIVTPLNIRHKVEN